MNEACMYYIHNRPENEKVLGDHGWWDRITKIKIKIVVWLVGDEWIASIYRMQHKHKNLSTTSNIDS